MPIAYADPQTGEVFVARMAHGLDSVEAFERYLLPYMPERATQYWHVTETEADELQKSPPDEV